MQVSLNWLSEYTDISDLTPESIASGLTIAGLEVEEIERTGPKFENIKVAKIVEINNHPNADKLHLVTVDIGKETKTVVCGAQNIEVMLLLDPKCFQEKQVSNLNLLKLQFVVLNLLECCALLMSWD